MRAGTARPRSVRIVVVGVVQGVGFRPFVAVLARRWGLSGYVRNTGGGEVEIRLEGPPEAIEGFLADFKHRRPPAIRVERLRVEEREPEGFRGFEIKRSSKAVLEPSIIPPDMAICRECLGEVTDPGSRRYRYPFNSCSYCGPRFAVLESLPYDRERTSWRDWPMCRDCSREYWSPEVGGLRRYYYQGISCPSCGPRLKLLTGDGEPVEARDPLEEAARLVEEGYIVAVKGYGGFHLAVKASDGDAVARLRERKRRPTKPFAVMAASLEVARRLVEVDGEAARVLESPERPILLLKKRRDSPVSELVSPGLDREGVFLPVTALHFLLLSSTRDGFAIMTSGNISGEPMCTTLECVLERLRGVPDYILDHGLRIVHRVDDSVARFTRGRLVLIRRARGYAPQWIRLPLRLPRPVIAFGAELDNVGAVAFGDKAVLTQHIGDTDEIHSLEDLGRELEWLARQYRISRGEALHVADLNPAFHSGRLCEEWSGGECVRVQHHHAHALSAAAEMGVGEGSLIAIAIDGVGYGADGMAWGGEVLLVEGDRFERLGHLRYVPMPGGDKAAIYPGMMAVSLLLEALGSEDEVLEWARRLGLTEAPPVRGEAGVRLVVAQARRSPLKTSSLGRFLDAVSAALGVRRLRTYEGEPAIALEAYSRPGERLDKAAVEGFLRGGRKLEVDTPGLFIHVLEHALEGDPRRAAWLAQAASGYLLGRIACEHAAEASVKEVPLTGGAAVNEYVAWGVEEALRECGASLYLHRLVPPGDGGIALGQALYAAHHMRR